MILGHPFADLSGLVLFDAGTNKKTLNEIASSNLISRHSLLPFVKSPTSTRNRCDTEIIDIYRPVLVGVIGI